LDIALYLSIEDDLLSLVSPNHSFYKQVEQQC